MKKVIKKIMDYICHLLLSTHSKQIINKLKEYDIVSFDIFDTLIKRNVYNEKDIFKVVEKKYNLLYSDKVNDFYNERIKAEKTARDQTSKEEITLDEIYSFINYPDKVTNELKNIEIETEIEMCCQNKDMYEIYKYCCEKNKKILIISDMYLPDKIIEEILKRNGYKVYDELYVSSKCNLKKSNGKVFDFILNKDKNSGKKMIHIGDNAISDYIMPKTKGINALLIKQKIKNNKFYGNTMSRNNLAYNIMMTTINNELKKEEYLEKNFVSILTPLLYGYCIELKKYIKDNNIDNIYFLARDAKIIYDAYISLYPNDINICHYMNISRKSITFSSFSNNIDTKEFENVADSIIKRKKICEIISILELNIDNYKEELISNNIDINKEYETLKAEDKEAFLNIISTDFQKFCEKQKELFKEFLLQSDFKGNVCLVDIGWKGTIQNKLEIFCQKNNIEANIYGYYMGIYETNKYKKGYIYNGTHENKYMIYSSVGLFELLFLNNEGSTLYYEKTQNIIKPIKGRYEQEPELEELIKKVQRNSVNIIKILGNLMFEINPQTAFYNYKKLVVNPKLSFVNKVKNIKFNDGGTYNLVENKKNAYYIIRPKELKKDLINSYYKIGFLKNIFKIYLPYNLILKILYKKVKGE